MPETIDKRPLKVFISYASQDKPVVQELSRRLVGEEWIDAWLDVKKLLPGQDWRVMIEEAVESSDIVIICLSSNSVSKEGYVQKELRYAREIALEKPEETIFLVPLRLDECDIPRGLRFFQWADYFGEKKEETYTALLESLKLRYEQKLKTEEDKRIRQEKGNQERKSAEIIAREKLDQAVEKSVESKSLYDRTEENKRRFSGLNSIFNWNKSFFFVFIAIIAIILSLSSNNKWFSLLSVVTETPTATFRLLPTETPSRTITPSPTLTETITPTPTLLPVELTDAEGIPMRLVPVGEFTMGYLADDATSFCHALQSKLPWFGACRKENYLREEPIHKVYLENFFMDVHEVSNEEYKKCVLERVCMQPSSNSANRYSSYYDNETFRNYPVIHVSWEMAKTYCEWRGARLPTEAEWEKAARGTFERSHPWGNFNSAYDVYDRSFYVNRANLNLGDVNKATMPVDSNPQGLSPYGLYNMAGNVAEWVADWYGETYYGESPSKNPFGPSTGEYKVIRGGSINTVDIRTSFRDYKKPSDYDSATGIRCAKHANP